MKRSEQLSKKKKKKPPRGQLGQSTAYNTLINCSHILTIIKLCLSELELNFNNQHKVGLPTHLLLYKLQRIIGNVFTFQSRNKFANAKGLFKS